MKPVQLSVRVTIPTLIMIQWWMEWIMLFGRLISVQHNPHRRLMKLKICPKIVFILIFFVLCTLFFVVPKIEAAESLYYIHQDHLGSTSLVTDSTGKVVSKQSYYPYGTTRSYSQLTADNSQPERQYTGQVSDIDSTGLYYYNARYYNPTIAKFTQADTNNNNLNRYTYTDSNPVNLIDPSGYQETRFDDEGFVNKDPGGFEGVVLDIAKYIVNIYVGAIPRWNATPSWYRKAIHKTFIIKPGFL